MLLCTTWPSQILKFHLEPGLPRVLYMYIIHLNENFRHILMHTQTLVHKPQRHNLMIQQANTDNYTETHNIDTNSYTQYVMGPWDE